MVSAGRLGREGVGNERRVWFRGRWRGSGCRVFGGATVGGVASSRLVAVGLVLWRP